ncbi:hypothetical protein O6H91_04G048300 [Diphasiastrum complanatum]|uniref:Uncharacterized protein n=1 Tax=Diphasiastrum complanatum TaxID=34168 RepID=A0ACC2DX82_DIPCM|nr:hypothetical protein O6H91_04G048300 [Diphasiastrum complanatum]
MGGEKGEARSSGGVVVERPKQRRGGSSMAIVGVAAAALALGGTGAAFLYTLRPRDPIFEVVSINLKGFNIRFVNEFPLMYAVLDFELELSIKVINPNVVPIEYTSTVMDIFYRGDPLGQATVPAGSQEANSTKILDVPAKLDGLNIKNHIVDLIKDITKREMSLHSVVTIKGHAKLWKLKHNFEVCVESDIKVDPIQLDIIEQENKVHMELEPIVS